MPLGNAAWFVHQNDALSFKFVTDTIAGASLPFEYPAPRGEDALLVRFRDMPSWNEVGPDAFIVALSLEVLQ